MSISLLPNGNISPSRFVKLDSSENGGYCLQCGAGDPPIGISQAGTRQPPIEGLDDGYAGVAETKEILVYTETDECWLEAGGTVTFGDYLKADTNGKGVTASSDGDNVGAQALQSATSGQLLRVKVMRFMRGA